MCCRWLEHARVTESTHRQDCSGSRCVSRGQGSYGQRTGSGEWLRNAEQQINVMWDKPQLFGHKAHTFLSPSHSRRCKLSCYLHSFLNGNELLIRLHQVPIYYFRNVRYVLAWSLYPLNVYWQHFLLNKTSLSLYIRLHVYVFVCTHMRVCVGIQNSINLRCTVQKCKETNA